MKHSYVKMINNSDGFALVAALLVMTMVMIVGAIATRTATTELNIAGYDKYYKKTWYATDSVVRNVGPGLAEQDIAERGFNGGEASEDGFTIDTGISSLRIFRGAFYLRDKKPDDTCEVFFPSSTSRDFELGGRTIGASNIYLKYQTETELAEGNALQLAEGYHGRGKGIAGGGAYVLYMLRAVGMEAPMNAQVRMTYLWRYVI